MTSRANRISLRARRFVASLAAFVAAGSLTTCRLSDLLSPGAVGTLASTPAEFADSVLAGSTAIRQYDVALRVDGTGERLRFAASAELGSSWIILGPATGTAPGTWSFSVDPAGLAVGEYVDTIRFVAEGPDAPTLRVPVRFKLLPCAATDLGVLPATVAGALTTADCASPRFTDRFARRYRFTATANDSISVQLGSTAFGPSVAIERVGTPTPIATTNGCTVAAASACLRYVLLTTPGEYIIEATSTGARATGAFTLTASRPRAPNAPAALTQLTVGATPTVLAAGGTLGANQVSLQGALSDADGDSLRYELELRAVGIAFTGVATHTVPLGTGMFAVTASSLIDGTSYKWRARAVDVTGRASAWTEFGGNAADAADFTVNVPDAPAAPTGLAQRRADGVTSIPLLGTTTESSVVLGATVVDSDPSDQIRLEVEVRPIGTAISNTATHTSLPVASGGFASVTVAGLNDNVGYRWQARAVDQGGRASAWVRFSPSGETFRVALPPTQLAFVAGPSSVAAGATIAPAIQVAARDAGGATLTSYTGAITIALGDSPGATTLGGTLTVNAVSGIATFSDLRIDVAGTPYTLLASAGALTVESAPFSVTAASAQTLAFQVSPTAVTAGVTIAPAITVVVRDAFGNVANDYSGNVSLAVAPNGAGATLLGATTVAASNGTATFSGVRVERAATGLSFVASASGFADAASGAFDVNAASASTLRLATPPSTSGASGAPLAQQPVVVVEDAFGNRVRAAGTTVTATIASGPAGTLANAQAITDADGQATFVGLGITGPSGAYTIAFGSGALTGAVSGSITLSAGGATRLAIAVAPSSTVANAEIFAVEPIIRLEDAAGNPVAQAGVAVTASLASGAPALSGTTTVLTDASGEAQFTDLVFTGTTGARTLSFAAAGLTGVTSGTISVIAGAAVEMLAVAGDGQSATAGSAVAVAPTVLVRDVSQNPVPGVSVAFAVTAGGGSIVPPAAVVTGADGRAALTSWTLGAVAGANAVDASVNGLTGSPVTFTATGTSGAATQLQITGGDNLSGPVATTLGTPHEVRVTDANGNPVAGVTVVWAAVGGGSVNPGNSNTDADGRATTTRTLGVLAGNGQSTTATATLAGGTTSVTFTITATVGGATQLQLSAGDAQADTVGATLATPLAVLARDNLGNPVPGVLITWSVTDGGGNVNPTTSTTNASGIATTSWTLGTATSSTDSTQLARASGVGSPVNFVATSRPGAVSAAQTTVAVLPAAIAASRGTPATVTVTARDRFGNMIPGRTVALSADGVGNTIAQPAAVTGANGQTTGGFGATVSGARTIVATVDGLTITQQPTVTVTAAPAASLVFLAVPANGASGVSLTPPIEVGAVDSLGNRNFVFTGAITLGLAVNPAGGTLGGTLTRNAIAGVAAFPGISLDRAADGYVLVATSTGLNGATSPTIGISSGAISAARSTLTVSSNTLVAGTDTATITVTARDAADNPIAGASVTLAATGAASALEQPLGVTDANGVATGRVSATITGARTVSATIGAVSVTQTAVVTVTPAAISGTLSTIGALPATIAAGGPTSTITVTARDVHGNVVPNATVALAATGSGNSITQPALTDANGVASGTLASTAAGTKTVSATANGVALSSTVDVAVTAGAVSTATSTLTIAPDTVVAGGAVTTVTITARDANGNPVAGASVVLSATGAGNTITQPAALTDASGVATGSVSSTAAGTKVISAAIGGASVVDTDTLVVRPAAVSPSLSTIALDASATSAGAAPIAVTVTAYDAFANPIPGVAVVIAATGTGNTLTQPPTLTDALGVVHGAIASSDAGVKTVSATIDGVPITATADLTVTAGAVSATQSTLAAAPDAISADGGTSTITVTARDASGNPIAGLTVTLVASGAGNSITQPGAVTDANGVATGSVSSTIVGAKVVTATIDGTPIDQADTITVSVGAVSAVTSSITAAPDSISADGGASTITVIARDQHGNLVAGETVVLAATGAGNALTQPAAVTDVDGVATGSLASTGAGAKVITASIGGVAITPNDTVIVRAGAVSGTLSTIGVASGTISAAVGSTVVTVTAHDAHGNAVPGVAVVLSATGTGNTLTQPAAVTDASGVATGSFASTVSESKTISATADGTALTATASVTVVPDAVSAAQSSVVVAPSAISADGETATITVTARDASGNPVAGVTVAIASTGSGNSLTQPAATTDANGVATGTIAATVAGARTISATVNGVAVSQTDDLVVHPGAVSPTLTTVSAVPNAIIAGGTGSTITVTARDQHGNAIPDLAVTLAASGAGNTVTQPAAVTDASGIATGTVASTIAGDKIVTATAGVVAITSSDTISVAAGAVSGAQSSLTAAPDALSADGGASTITVTARDAFGNVIAGRTVVLAATGAGNTLTQPAAVTDAAGVATGSLASTGAGLKEVSATIDGVSVAQTDTVIVAAGAIDAAQSSVVADPTTLTAGAGASTVTVTARDAHGNPVAGAAVTFTASGTGNTLTQPAAVTDASGVTTGSLSSTGAGAKEIIATIGGVVATQRDTVTVSAAAASMTASTIVAAPNALVAGSGSSTITVTALDAFNNPVAGVSVVLAATGSGNALTQPAAVTDASGVTSGSFSSTGAGSKEITATLGGQALVARDTIEVTVGAVSAALSTLAAAPDTISADGATATVTVTARDANGNPIAGAAVVLAASGAGVSITQPATVTDASGVATGTVARTTVGASAITATIATVAIDAADTVVIVPGAPSAATSTVEAAPASLVAGGGTSTITVTARDQHNNPIPGAAVTLAATGTGNTLTQPAAVTDANGVTTGTISSTVAGAKDVSATVGSVGVTQTATVTFTAGTVSAALSTVVLSQPSMVAGTAATTVTITARDANGNAVPGVAVTLAATGAGNTITQPAALTDADGVATGSVASTTAETKTITATIDGVVATQEPTLTVTPAAAAAGTSTVSASPTSIVASGAGTTITVTARDQFGNLVPGVTVVIAATGTGNTLTQPAAVTDADGVTTGTVASSVADTKTVSATVDGVAVTQTADVTVTAGAASAATSTVSAAPDTVSADGGASTVTITVRDADNNPIAGASVTLSASGSGNTITQPVGVTDAAGVITGAISSTGAGTKTVTAVVGATTITQTADVVVIAGAPTAAQSTVAALPASIIAGGGASTITITALDQHGNPVAGATVSLGATGTNTLTQPAAVTDANGQTTGSLASTETGDKVVTATIGAVTVTQTATVTVTPAAIDAGTSTVAVSAATIAAASGSSTVTVTARDQFGNVVPGATVVVSATGSNNAIVGPAAVTDANGVATATFSSTTSESKTISATAGGVAITQTQVVAVVPDAADAAQSTVGVSANTFVAGDAGITVTVTARDASGNPVPNVSVVVSATGAGNTVTGPLATTDANGVVTATLTSTGAGAKTVSATVNGVAVTQTQAVTVTPAALSTTTSSVAADPTSISADGGTSTITVTARDAHGNVIEGLTVVLSGSGTGNSFTQPAADTDANGVTTGTFASTGAGAHTISATIDGQLITPTTQVTVTPGAVNADSTTVVAVPDTITAGGGSSTIIVTARDSYGNVIPGQSVALALAAPGANLTQPAAATDANGVATGTLSATIAGDKFVSAEVEGVAITQFATVTVTPAAVDATNSTLVADSTTMTAGTNTSAITVTAFDQFNNPIPGATVVILATGGGNAITQPAGVTDADGIAVGAFASTTAGTKTITATINGTLINATDDIAITAGGVDAGASTVTADSATIAAGTGVTTVTVTARDANNNPVAGATVVLAASGTGNTLVQPVAVTDANGVATGTFTSTSLGAHSISATAAAVGITATASVTVVVGPASLGESSITSSPSSITTDDASTITVQLRDAGGNPLTASGGVVTLGTDLGVLSAVTDNNDGTYTATLTSTSIGTATILGQLNGNGFGDDEVVTITVGAVSASTSSVTAARASITAGDTVTVTVVARDAANNPIAGATVSLSLDGAASSSTPASGPTDANGEFSAVLTTTLAGSFDIVADIAGTDVTSAAPLGVTAAAVSALVFTQQPSNVAGGDAIAPAIQLEARDQYGNVNTAYAGNVTIGIEPGSGTTNAAVMGTSTATVAAVNGIVDFADIRIDSAGTGYQLRATDGTVTSAASSAFDVTPGAVSTAMSEVQTSAPAVDVLSSVTFTLIARDALGNRITTGGATVEFTLDNDGDSQGTILPVTANDHGDGTYTSSFTGTVAGTPRTIRASIGGVPVTTPGAPTITVNPLGLLLAALR